MKTFVKYRRKEIILTAHKCVVSHNGRKYMEAL